MPLHDRLIGHWQLESFTERRADGSSFDVWGPDPVGFITYLPTGRMSVVFAGSHRARFAGAWSAVTDAAKAAQYDAMVAYSGRFTAYEDRVVHHVEVCWIPNWEGRDLERAVTLLDDDRVLLRTPEARFGRAQPVQDVVVRRVR
jgi:hypothetical protein